MPAQRCQHTKLAIFTQNRHREPAKKQAEHFANVADLDSKLEKELYSLMSAQNFWTGFCIVSIAENSPVLVYTISSIEK